MDTGARYRYFTTDLLTNTLLAEIPFQGVGWSRAIRRAGEFSGNIPVIDENTHLDLYNSTMPGRTALYVMRNDACVWGGIIWSREYDPENRTLSVSGAEFISYFYHRFVWKTLVDRSSGTPVGIYSMDAPIQLGSYSAIDGLATFTTRPVDLGEGSEPREHLLAPGNDIIIIGTGQPALDGGATVYQTPNASTFTVLIDSNETISGTETTSATFRKSMDNYKFVRDIVKRTADDFAGIEIPRDEYQPGFTAEYSVLGKQRTENTARLTLNRPHTLIPGQEVVVKDVDEVFDGLYAVTSTPSELSFEYENAGSDLAAAAEDGLRTLDITAFSVTGGKVTLTLAENHNASVGDEVVVNANRPRSKTSITNQDMDLFDETEQIDEITAPDRLVYNRQSLSNSFWYFKRNITKRGIDYQASPEKWVVKLEVETPHNYLTTGKIKVQGANAPFDGEHEIDTIPANNQVTYLINRSRSITRRTSRGGVVTLYTNTPHGYRIGETVTISNFGDPNDKGYNGSWVIDGTPGANRFTFKKQVNAQKNVVFSKGSTEMTLNSGETSTGLLVDMTIACSGVPADAKIKSISTSGGSTTVELTKKTTGEAKNITVQIAGGQVASGSQTITVTDTKNISAGMTVHATGIPAGTLVSSVATNGKKITLSADTTANIASGANIRFETLSKFVKDFPDRAGNDNEPPANATAKITSDFEFEPIKISRDEIITETNTIEVKGGGTATLGPRVYAGTYGGFEDNSDIGIEFSEETNAGVFTRREIFIGSSLLSVGEILEEASSGPNGFEYRIDCAFDTATQSFKRTLVLSGYDYPDDPEPGDIRSAASLGADKFVFDYPGNIASFKFEESAENAATRMWVTGTNSTAGGDDTKQPMAGASSKKMLRSGWPVLDAAEQIDAQSGAIDLYDQAKSYLNEALPPIDDLTVSVNGSMDPEVGSYVPGDWCSLLFDDAFVRLRLASDQEPRDDMIVRKILGFKVDVPDAYGVPETVDLELIRDVEVEEIGNQSS
jgi:hypothetical protein